MKKVSPEDFVEPPGGPPSPLSRQSAPCPERELLVLRESSLSWESASLNERSSFEQPPFLVPARRLAENAKLVLVLAMQEPELWRRRRRGRRSSGDKNFLLQESIV